MGRRLNLSTPTVIQTELPPLDESFYIEADGTLEQWYYDNTMQFQPNRKITNLTLTPILKVVDSETGTGYTPSFYYVNWYIRMNGTETLVTANADSSSVDYYKSQNNLVVKKNVSYSTPIVIRCEAKYTDPRDSGVTYTVRETVTLTTNRDATVLLPEVAITSPSARSYNPLTDDTNSQYTFDGTVTNSPEQEVVADFIQKYKATSVIGTEEVLAADGSAKPIMDIRYGDTTKENESFWYRKTNGGTAIEGDTGYIEKIKGNSVKWNQLGLVNSSSAEVYGITRTRINATTMHYSGTATQATSFTCGGNMTYKGGNVYYRAVKNIPSTCKISNGAAYGIDSQIYSPQNDIENNFGVDIPSGAQIDNDVYIIVVNLTTLYGAGNEPTTVEAFESDYESWFGKPLTYETYDTGSIRNVKLSGMKSAGFNLWDEQWELGALGSSGELSSSRDFVRTKNAIKVMPNTSYYYKNSIVNSRVYFYDANMNAVDSKASAEIVNKTFTTPSNCYYIKFFWYGTTYHNDICINFSDADRNGTYEAYDGETANVPVTTMKGTASGSTASVVVFPDGLKKIGDVQDEMYVDENGIVHGIKRIGSVDMGTLDWKVKSDFGGVFSVTVSTMKLSRSNVISCGRYKEVSPIASVSTAAEDKTIFNHDWYYNVYVKDSSYSDAAAFKAVMSGVMLQYELATPIDYTMGSIYDLAFVWYGISNNAEVLADTLPWYVSGQGSSSLVVDALYGDDITVVLRARKNKLSDELSPSKAYASVKWRIPDVDTAVVSENGGAVRSSTTNMTFSTIVNIKGGGVVSDAIKTRHMRFNWKYRKNNSTTETDAGWGNSVTISAANLRNTRGSESNPLASTLVYPYVYILGPYEAVTENGVTTYERSIN